MKKLLGIILLLAAAWLLVYLQSRGEDSREDGQNRTDTDSGSKTDPDSTCD